MSIVPIEETRAAYNTVAATYAELVGDTSFEAGIDLAMVEHFLQQVGINREAQVLDAGCGAGRMMTYLKQLDPSVQLTGIDLAPGMVARARRNHPDRRIEEGDLAALPFANAQFEGLLSWYSIIHTPTSELPRIVAEFRRVLRPGGLLLVAFHAGGGERIAQHAYGHDVQLRVQLHEAHRVEEALVTGGFEGTARLERVARPSERNRQGFVLMTRT